MSYIQLRHVTKKFGEKILFKDYNLDIEHGEFVGIEGRSGSGKTTLLNIIGLLEKCQGEVLYDGKKMVKPKEKMHLYRDRIGYLFQNFALIDDETVENNLNIVRYGRDKKLFAMKMRASLEKVGLGADLMSKRIYQLSGGEQQRVAIARILAGDKDIILADEPTGSLDKENSYAILELLHEMNKEGKTIVMVSHDPDMFRYCIRKIHI